ncbi:sugar phosphate isomerase/epimerase [Nocardia terpenica]|nr:sugar phosphate isomerase/epimerase [Nocardia terpenica]MBF6104180.1 sugar phosphate isomerase/epimerase [Nocardia terpenica]MBF6109964.1 sugar phosphate isomerase/epimerase [Nocardia terpenica]MBF6120270.1 sugar phosphate isomerase/epimerase [Nocardia terpenica]MBF6152682.1 sugar phosphate isomerase/epimerase [Nocardia terpenica]
MRSTCTAGWSNCSTRRRRRPGGTIVSRSDIPCPRAGIGDEAHAALNRQIEAVTELGWNRLELRSIGGTALADLDDTAFARAAMLLARSGVDVVCLDSRIGNWGRPITAPFADDMAELRVLCLRAAALNCRHIRIMSYPNDGLPERDWAAEVLRRIRELTALAADHGLILLHENCAGWAGTDPRRAADLLHAIDSPALRLLFDTGNGPAHGYPDFDYLETVVDLIDHVHIKDAVHRPEGVRYVHPGEGECQVADSIRLLLDHGYTGVFSIEPHLTLRPHEAMTELTDITEFVDYGRYFDEFLSALLPEEVS